MSEKLHSYFIICTIDKFSKFTMKRNEQKNKRLRCIVRRDRRNTDRRNRDSILYVRQRRLNLLEKGVCQRIFRGLTEEFLTKMRRSLSGRLFYYGGNIVILFLYFPPVKSIDPH